MYGKYSVILSMLVTTMVSCMDRETDRVSIFSYVAPVNQDNPDFFVYQHVKDSMQTFIFLHKEWQDNQDGSFNCRYSYFNVDSQKFAESVEQYWSDSLRLISVSFYDSDSSLDDNEITGIFNSRQSWSWNSDADYLISFTPKSDTEMTITINFNVFGLQSQCENKGKTDNSCLEICGKESYSITFSDGRSDTSYYTRSIRHFCENEGMTTWIQVMSNGDSLYYDLIGTI